MPLSAITSDITFQLFQTPDPVKSADESGNYPLPNQNIFKVVNVDNTDVPVSLVIFGGVVPSPGNLIYTPFYAALWNPTLPHGESIIRPAIYAEDISGADDLIREGGLSIHEVGQAPQIITYDDAALLRSLRTGDFTKFRIGIHPRPEYFPKPLVTLSLHFTTSYILDDAPVFTPQEYGTRQYFPAHFGGLPTRMRFEDCPITVQIMLK